MERQDGVWWWLLTTAVLLLGIKEKKGDDEDDDEDVEEHWKETTQSLTEVREQIISHSCQTNALLIARCIN